MRFAATIDGLDVGPGRRAALRFALPSGVVYRDGTTSLDGRTLADVDGVGPLWAGAGLVLDEEASGARTIALEGAEFALLPGALRAAACAELIFEDGRRSIVATLPTGAAIGREAGAVTPAARTIVRGRERASTDDEAVGFAASFDAERAERVLGELAAAGVRGLARHLFAMELLFAETIAIDPRTLAELREALRVSLERLFVRVQFSASAARAEPDLARLRETAADFFRAVRTEAVIVPPASVASVSLFGSLVRGEARAIERRLGALAAGEAETWIALAHLCAHGARCGTERRRVPSRYRSLLIEALEALRPCDSAAFTALLAGPPRPELDDALDETLAALGLTSAAALRDIPR